MKSTGDADIDKFYYGHEFVSSGLSIGRACLHLRDRLKTVGAKRHVAEGFWKRHGMLEASWLFLRDRTSPERKAPLDVHEAETASIHLNAYYLNLRGSLDNLAWALAYEFKLKDPLDEDDAKVRRWASLGGGEFRGDVKKQVCDALGSYSTRRPLVASTR
ncbi:MAG: hypothetical protein IPK60_20805 [Sandaracinaceae bacterium]|nr:hypothetical protein [Sandaracinaceae bacterium]